MVSSITRSGPCDTTCRMVEMFEKLSIDEQRILTRLVNDWKKRDQRRHSRTPCSIITEYRSGGQVYKDTIKNISLGGAYIESIHHFPLNRVIDQSFYYPNFEIRIQCKSRIIWTDPNGFGVKFNPSEDE